MITTHNEPIKCLIKTIVEHKCIHDTIIIIDDFSTEKHTTDFFKYADTVVRRKFISDYAYHKNTLFDICTT